MGFLESLFLLLLVCSFVGVSLSVETGSGVDVEALKAFKSLISRDTVQVLADWVDENHHCNWTGISCDPSSSRVITISLFERQLKGEISPFLGNISTLQVLDLITNGFTGSIPVQLGRITGLQAIGLRGSSLSGSIPVEFGYLNELEELDLGENFLSGSIPESICNCTGLVELGIGANNLTGVIPSCIELAYTSEVSTKADVFSFGVLVMEFLTRRRPTGTIEDNGVPISLRQFMEAALTNGIKRLLQVVDPNLASSVSAKQEEDRMVDLIKLGLF